MGNTSLPYKNYIFDLYGTLVDIQTDENKDSLWEELTRFLNERGAYFTKEEAKMWYEKLCVEEELNLKNRISFATNKKITHQEINVIKVFQRMYAKKGITPSLELSTHTAQLFRTLSTNYIKPYDHIVDLLTELKCRGGKIYLLSNAQHAFTSKELEDLEFVSYFDDIFLSSNYQHKKPDKSFFEALLEKHNLDTSTTIMIGNDLTSDIAGGHSMGMDTLYIHANISPNYSPSEEKLYTLPTHKIMDGSTLSMKEWLLREQ